MNMLYPMKPRKKQSSNKGSSSLRRMNSLTLEEWKRRLIAINAAAVIDGPVKLRPIEADCDDLAAA